jgi:hypothetical protein
MSQDTQLLEGIKSLLARIADNMHPQEPIGIIGGDVQSALPFLDGWTYINEKPAPPIPIVKGQRKSMFSEWSDEEGWTLGGQVIFDDPDAHLHFALDNLDLDSSPRLVSQVNEAVAGIVTVRTNVYNPVIKAYGFSVSISQLAPYKNRVRFEAYLGNESLNSTANVTLFQMARVKINDRKAFFASLKRFAYQQSNGTRNATVREN